MRPRLPPHHLRGDWSSFLKMAAAQHGESPTFLFFSTMVKRQEGARWQRNTHCRSVWVMSESTCRPGTGDPVATTRGNHRAAAPHSVRHKQPSQHPLKSSIRAARTASRGACGQPGAESAESSSRLANLATMTETASGGCTARYAACLLCRQPRRRAPRWRILFRSTIGELANGRGPWFPAQPGGLFSRRSFDIFSLRLHCGPPRRRLPSAGLTGPAGSGRQPAGSPCQASQKVVHGK